MGLGELTLFLVQLLAGTGVFLVGVHLLTGNIEQLATGKLKALFGQTADRRLVNVGIGAAATALIQSSGVTTVLIVGFVNVGLINLYQATAMIMGANIGTTITAQIAALSAFPITTYIQILVFAGIMISMICKSDNMKKTGFILAGLGLIFVGLGLMSEAMRGSRDAVQALFETVTNPLALFLIGIFLTALVQSSSATTSIIIAMSVAGLSVGTGGNEVLYIILGTNIGSCVTALMSSFTAGTNARRAGLIHLLFNTFGSLLFSVLLMAQPDFMEVTFRRWFTSPATQIAMFHTFFNVICTVIFLPFCRGFVRISQAVIRDRRAETPDSCLDERILSSPALAIAQLKKELVRLSDLAMDAFGTAYHSFQVKDKGLIVPVQKRIEEVNALSQSIINYLVRLSSQSMLSEEQSISDLYNNVGDIVRIAEIADNFTKYTRRTVDGELEFSEEVRGEVDAMVERVERLYRLVREILLEEQTGLLDQVDETEDEIDGMRRKLIDNHIERLNRGLCKPECSGVFINMVSNLERLGDHLTYVAHAGEPA